MSPAESPPVPSASPAPLTMPVPVPTPVAAVAVLWIAGAVLRVLRLGTQSFWYDEAVSAKLSSAPAWDLVTGRVRDLGNPLLHNLVLHG